MARNKITTDDIDDFCCNYGLEELDLCWKYDLVDNIDIEIQLPTFWYFLEENLWFDTNNIQYTEKDKQILNFIKTL